MVTRPAEYFPDGLTPRGELQELAGVAVPMERHILTGDSASALSGALRSRASEARTLSFERVCSTLEKVHAAWAQPNSTWREQAVGPLALITGYPASLIDAAVQRLFASLDRQEMGGWFAASGIEPLWLDEGPVFGPELTVIVSSGNIPGAAVPSIAQALLLKSPALVKTASAEPLLLPLYARSIAEADPEVARALVVTGWDGGDSEGEKSVLAEADAVIVYGSNEAVRRLRAEAPAHARFIGYGHRISFSAIGRECMTRDGAAELVVRAARDFAEFDQQGCLSPQALYIEKGGELSPAEFGELLVEALEQLERELPRRALSASDAAAIHQYRARIEMEALGDPEIRLWSSSEGTPWTVALERDSALQPCPLNRTVIIRPLESLDELPAALKGRRGLLLSAGLEVGEHRRKQLEQLLAGCGVTRIARIGEAQRPRGALFHDGVDVIGMLARRVVVER